MRTEPPFVPEKIVATLASHGVDYILIGGMAAVAWQSPYQTRDVDICPANENENLKRLAAALGDMKARRVTDLEPEGVEVNITPEYLAAENELAFMTSFGPLDLIFVPRGTGGYEELRREAVTDQVFGAKVTIASLDDVVRMKDARGLPKDRYVVTLLREIQDRNRRQRD